MGILVKTFLCDGELVNLSRFTWMAVADCCLADVGEGGQGGLSQNEGERVTSGLVLTWLEVPHRIHTLQEGRQMVS